MFQMVNVLDILTIYSAAEEHRCKKTFQKKIKNVKKRDKNKKKVCKR